LLLFLSWKFHFAVYKKKPSKMIDQNIVIAVILLPSVNRMLSIDLVQDANLASMSSKDAVNPRNSYSVFVKSARNPCWKIFSGYNFDKVIWPW
jgi:hypothetical protein